MKKVFLCLGICFLFAGCGQDTEAVDNGVPADRPAVTTPDGDVDEESNEAAEAQMQ